MAQVTIRQAGVIMQAVTEAIRSGRDLGEAKQELKRNISRFGKDGVTEVEVPGELESFVS